MGVSNVFDRKPATDFETYGAIGYYPLDYVGAIGRAFGSRCATCSDRS